MKLFTRFILSGCLLLTSGNYLLAQPGATGYVDNALNYNRMIIAKTSEGYYKLIGVFKVIGTSYLFGEHNKGDMFAPESKAYNVFISYNTYNQEVEFYSTSNTDKPLVKEPGSIDSFIIQPDIDLGITNPLKFVYAPLLGIKDKYYFQEVYKGGRFSLYKRYKSDLGYVSSNYIQSELRQFDLDYEYYYTDTEKKGVKKIKSNAFDVVKEFKDIKDLSAVVDADAFSVNPEEAFRKAFDHLNN